MASIVCWASGHAEVVNRVPAGTIVLVKGQRSRLEEVLSAHARHGYDGQALLVPGVPEATDSKQALEALEKFQARLENDLEMWPEGGEEDR